MIRTIVRAVLQFATPFLIGKGRGDTRADEVFVADASGLPAIPGTSLAGVLREAYGQIVGGGGNLPAANELFGFQESGARADESRGSAVHFSWGALHDSQNRPVEGLRRAQQIGLDPVLALAREGVHRHHVRLSHRGVADGRCKFDVAQVAAGHRFSFEMMLDDDENGKLTRGLDKLVALLSSGQIALGGGRGGGLGRFKIIRLYRGSFDLQTPAGYRAMASLGHALGDTQGLTPQPIASGTGDTKVLTVTLPLAPRGLWFVGAGETDPDDRSGADMGPAREVRVVWDGDRGKPSNPRLVIAGSALRGPLRHRVAFHYNRLKRAWAQNSTKLNEVTEEENEAVRKLFGRVANTRDESRRGQRGLVRVPDVLVEDKPGQDVVLPHVSIDRFTGGPLDGFLFTEKARLGDKFTVVVEIDLRAGPLEPHVADALACALRDLAEGRLQIGAGSGRGNGFLKLRQDQKLDWPDVLAPPPAVTA